MSLTAPELTGRDPRVDLDDVDGAWVSPVRPTDDDVIVVTCAACGAHQQASGRASGFTCDSCMSVWQVLRCPGCRKASIVAAGVSACPRCGHDRRAREASTRAPMPSWLTEPDPLSVWLGGVKYLGGHAGRDRPIASAGLLLDRRGIHLRAFAELFSIRWDTVAGIDVEGPTDISDRLTTSHLLALGATTWAMQVAYLTVHTPDGDAIFEVDGLSPPEVHARLSRVLQGLQRSERPPMPIAIERGPTPAPVAASAPIPEPVVASEPTVAAPAAIAHEPLTIDPQTSDAPLEVLVVDALWKLARLREAGLVDDAELRELRTRILARVPGLLGTPSAGPLLHV
jgi:predicted RNA-binding Zn-ribbon protein involved in translation (DUF1610 family)